MSGQGARMDDSDLTMTHVNLIQMYDYPADSCAISPAAFLFVKLSHCDYMITFCKPYIFVELPYVFPPLPQGSTLPPHIHTSTLPHHWYLVSLGEYIKVGTKVRVILGDVPPPPPTKQSKVGFKVKVTLGAPLTIQS